MSKKILTLFAAFYFALGISFAVYGDDVTNSNSNNTDNINNIDDNLDIPAPQTVDQQDPYQNYNRAVYRFNKDVDRSFIKPAAQVYKKVLPSPITKAISNFFTNIGNIPGILNDILQGSGYYTAYDFTRFFVNTTVGLGGLIDVASYRDLPQHNNDFGLTLAHWGYHSSAYFVVPFIGPCTLRDTFALPVDYGIFSPYLYATPFMGINFFAQYSITGLYVIDKRSQYLDFDPVMKEAAIDPYVFERDAYLQHRDSLIKNNNTVTDNSDKNNGADPYLSDGA